MCIVLSMQPFWYCYFIKCQNDIQILKNASGSVSAYGINPYPLILSIRCYCKNIVNDTSNNTYVYMFHLF
jgi:hypothetical protein